MPVPNTSPNNPVFSKPNTFPNNPTPSEPSTSPTNPTPPEHHTSPNNLNPPDPNTSPNNRTPVKPSTPPNNPTIPEPNILPDSPSLPDSYPTQYINLPEPHTPDYTHLIAPPTSDTKPNYFNMDDSIDEEQLLFIDDQDYPTNTDKATDEQALTELENSFMMDTDNADTTNGPHNYQPADNTTTDYRPHRHNTGTPGIRTHTIDLELEDSIMTNMDYQCTKHTRFTTNPTTQEIDNPKTDDNGPTTDYTGTPSTTPNTTDPDPFQIPTPLLASFRNIYTNKRNLHKLQAQLDTLNDHVDSHTVPTGLTIKHNPQTDMPKPLRERWESALTVASHTLRDITVEHIRNKIQHTQELIQQKIDILNTKCDPTTARQIILKTDHIAQKYTTNELCKRTKALKRHKNKTTTTTETQTTSTKPIIQTKYRKTTNQKTPPYPPTAPPLTSPDTPRRHYTPQPHNIQRQTHSTPTHHPQTSTTNTPPQPNTNRHIPLMQIHTTPRPTTPNTNPRYFTTPTRPRPHVPTPLLASQQPNNTTAHPQRPTTTHLSTTLTTPHYQSHTPHRNTFPLNRHTSNIPQHLSNHIQQEIHHFLMNQLHNNHK